MILQTQLILRSSLPLLTPFGLGPGVAFFATRSSNKTVENLSTAVSVASKRIKPPKAEKVAQKKPTTPRASSAYNHFLKANIAVVRAESSEKKSQAELFNAVSKNWKALTPSQKEPYLKLAEESKAAVAAQREILKAEKGEPRPLNSYAKFVQELVPSLRASYPGLSSPEVMKRAAGAWKSVSKAEKSRRQDQYLQAMAEWRDRNPPKPKKAQE